MADVQPPLFRLLGTELVNGGTCWAGRVNNVPPARGPHTSLLPPPLSLPMNKRASPDGRSMSYTVLLSYRRPAELKGLGAATPGCF